MATAFIADYTSDNGRTWGIQKLIKADEANVLSSCKNNPEIYSNGSQLSIKANDINNSTITIYSITGKQVFKGFIQDETQINMANNYGIYPVKFNKTISNLQQKY